MSFAAAETNTMMVRTAQETKRFGRILLAACYFIIATNIVCVTIVGECHDSHHQHDLASAEQTIDGLEAECTNTDAGVHHVGLQNWENYLHAGIALVTPDSDYENFDTASPLLLAVLPNPPDKIPI